MELYGESANSDNAPEEGRATFEEIAAAPHAVVADVENVEQARVVVEDLENSGVPTTSIELIEAETKEPRRPGTESDVAESDAFANLSKSTIVGGAVGIVTGALLGLALSYIIPGLGPVWGLILGGVFGAGIGGAAGGMSVAKYGSRAWDETYQVQEHAGLQVAVHHASVEVVEKAEGVMTSHLATNNVRRLR